MARMPGWKAVGVKLCLLMSLVLTTTAGNAQTPGYHSACSRDPYLLAAANEMNTGLNAENSDYLGRMRQCIDRGHDLESCVFYCEQEFDDDEPVSQSYWDTCVRPHLVGRVLEDSRSVPTDPTRRRTYLTEASLVRRAPGPNRPSRYRVRGQQGVDRLISYCCQDGFLDEICGGAEAEFRLTAASTYCQTSRYTDTTQAKRCEQFRPRGMFDWLGRLVDPPRPYVVPPSVMGSEPQGPARDPSEIVTESGTRSRRSRSRGGQTAHP